MYIVMRMSWYTYSPDDALVEPFGFCYSKEKARDVVENMNREDAKKNDEFLCETYHFEYVDVIE